MSAEHPDMQTARTFLRMLPFVRSLGMELEAFDDAAVSISMPYDPRLVGDSSTGVMHGGTMFALMDSACGTAVMAHPTRPQITATLDLRLEYFRAATPGQRILARAECYHMTRSVAFVRATAWDEDESRPVATATGVFTVTPAPQPASQPAPEPAA